MTFQVTFLSWTPPLPQACCGAWWEGPLCGEREPGDGSHHSPVEIHTLLGELPVAVVRVLEGLILDNLHTFSSVALFVAVLADHVQLSDFVLQNTDTEVSPTTSL